MRISDFLTRAKSDLESISKSPQLDAELLLAHVLQKPRTFLLARPEYLLSTGERKSAGIVLQQRKRGLPIAYIIGKSEFFGLDFVVSPDVLVPRPETELLVEAAIAFLTNGGTLLDIGTGSGCIAISVAKQTSAEVIATDISPSALSIARQNSEQHHVEISFVQSDLLAGIDGSQLTNKPIVITANLPYVPEAERHPSTAREPAAAIFSGADGLDHYRRFFAELHDFPFDACLFEFHSPQKDILEEILAAAFPHHTIEFAKDHAGLWRVGMIKNPET